jgi:hypothetical protein
VHAAEPGPLHVAQAASQVPQVRSVVAVHAVVWYWPDGHAPEHETQAPPLRYLPAAQLVQAVGPAPLQDPQLASHDVQTLSAVAEQAAVWYCPAGQAPEHAAQVSGVPATR